jgi:hypothetical protein
MRSLAVALALVALAGPVGAATQTILGGTFDLRTSYADDPTRRRVLVIGFEDVGTPNVVIGDPTIGGATLRIVVRGDAGTTEQTWDLPAAGWTAYITRHDWPVYMGYRYTSLDVGGAVRSITIERSGFSSPEGTPPPTEPKPGKFRMRIQMRGLDGPIDLVPPNLGTDAGVELTLGGGDTYCLVFGGAAGGKVVGNTRTRFGIRKPLGEGCP